MTSAIDIAGHVVGEGAPCFLIAEVAQAHDGSLGAAHAYIDAVADAGVDAIKFQTHIASAESTLNEPFRVRFSRQDATRFDYWRRMEFTAEQWVGLATHARERGLVFLSSPFSVEAVDLLNRIGMAAWKIGSGEVGTPDLINAICASSGPVLLSSGMSDYATLDQVVKKVRSCGRGLALFQCTSRYPVRLSEIGLNVIDELRYRFNCPVGLSDHSGTVYPALAAMARGADLIEAHVVFDRRMFGPDTLASLTLDEFRQLAIARDAFAEMLAHPVDKDAIATEMVEMRSMFGKSVALKADLPKGTILDGGVLTLKKPGVGIKASEIPTLLGRRLKHDVSALRLLSWDDVDE
jgi:N,N'-diacetyllegionaminate synthase